MSIYYDAQMRPVEIDEALVNYTGGYNPMLASKADVQRSIGRSARTLATQLGIGALGTGIQLAGTMAPTAQDTYNEAELAKLEGLARAGQLGLTGEERQQAEATIMNPVRQLATETRQRAEARLASMGDTGDVAGMQRVQRAEQEGIATAAGQAGTAIMGQHLQKKAEQRREMEERIAYQSERQKQPWELVGRALADLAPTLGTTMAGFAQARAPNDSELLAFARQKGPDGKPLYPDLVGKAADDLRTMWKQGVLVDRGNLDALALSGGEVAATAPPARYTSQGVALPEPY